MSYRSEIKKVITKYYPKYKVIKVLAPQNDYIGINDVYNLQINIEAKVKSKSNR